MHDFIKIFFFLILTQSVFSQKNKNIELLDHYFDKAFEHYYSNKDSALFYFNKIKLKAFEQNNIEYAVESLIYENWTANSVYNLDLIKENLHQLDSVLAKNKDYINTLKQKNYYIASRIYSKALYEYELKNYKKAFSGFELLINNLEKIPEFKNDPNLFNLYTTANNFIAKIYSTEGKYKLARQFYEQNLRNITPITAPNIEQINNIHILIAEIYQKENDYVRANKSILKVLDYYISKTKNSNRVISSLQSIVNNHISLKQLDSSKFYLQKMKLNLPKNHAFWHRYHEANAKILEAENNYTEAEEELKIALELIKKKWKNQPHNDIANAYNSIGQLHEEFNNPDKALGNYNLALQQFSSNADPSTINQTTVFKILKNKAHALLATSKNTECLKVINQAIETLDALKPSFKNNADKLFLMEEANPLFETGLQATYQLYEKTKQDSLIDNAFFFAEKSKSALLLESLLSTKATVFANIPKGVIEQEQVLKSKINHLEKQLTQSKNDDLQNELFELKNTYRAHITKLETNYKSYYNLKYGSKVVSITELQNLLKPDDILLSYFYGYNSIYSIAVSKESKSIHKYEIDNNLEAEINSIYQMLSNPKSDLSILNTASYDLYKKLIAPNLDNSEQKNLIIIADGLLNYIPFSSLNTNLEHPKYLLENYAISYANSATLLKQLNEKKGLNTNVLAIAPSFNSNASDLLPLPNNKAEVRSLLNYFNGKNLVDEQATLDNFNTDCNAYGILHFATHAIVNDETPEYSYLAFQPNGSHDSLLYVSDLYNLNLNSNLVTLSACETGIGMLKRGEGFMSLARGFYFSGASSISSTLWKINDASSSEIMADFYKNLSENKNKNSALQQAQLTFLNSNSQNALAHPYYWSGFVISGNTTALHSGSTVLRYALYILILVIVFFLIKKRLKSN